MASVAKIKADLQLSTGQFKRDVADSKADMTSLGAAIRERKNDFLMVENAARAQAAATRTAAQEAKKNAQEQTQAAREARSQAQAATQAARELAAAAKNAAPEMKKALEEQASAAKQYAAELRTVANAQSEVARQARVDAQEKSRIAAEAKQIHSQAKKAAKERSDAEKEASDAAASAAKKAQEETKKTADAIDDPARRATIAAAAITAVFVAGIAQYAKVNQALADLKSVTNASVQQLDQVRAAADKIGPAYGILPNIAVDATTEFVKAGVDLKRLADGELKDALSLIVAGELDVGDAANYASGALNTYKKENLSLKTVADIAAGAANASATSVREMTYANQALGPVAAQVSAKFEDVNAVLALFANNGLRGSDAGTSLKTTILAMINPTEQQQKVLDKLGLSFFDNQGKMKSFADIAEMLHTKLARFNDQNRGKILEMLGGTDGVRALSILANEGAQGLQEMDQAMKQVTADETAKMKIDSLNGSLKQLQAEAAVAGSKFGESFAPAAGIITSALTSILQKYNEVDTGTRSLINGAAGLALGFSGTVASVLLFVTALTKLKKAADEAKISMAALSTNPWILGLTAIIGVVTFLGTAYSESAEKAKKFAEAQEELNKAMQDGAKTKDANRFKEIEDDAKALEDMAKQMDDLNKKRADLAAGGWMGGKQKEIAAVDAELKKLSETMAEHGVTTDNVKAKAAELRQAMSDNIPMMQQLVEASISDAASKAQEIANLEKLRDRYNELTSKVQLNASETAELRSVTDQLKQSMPQLVVVEDERGRAIITNNEALNQRIDVEKKAAEASRTAAEKQINDQMAVAQAHLDSAMAVVEAYNTLSKARAAFLADAASGVDPTIDDEKRGKRLLVMADQAAKSAADAQKVIPIYEATISKYKDDLARVTGDAFSKIGGSSGKDGGGTDTFALPDDKKGKSAEQLEKEADQARRDSYQNDLAYSKQLLDTGAINEEQYVERLKDIRTSYGDWLAKHTQELYSINNEIEHESFNYSEVWIATKKQAMQDAGESSIAVSQMEMEGWSRVLQRTGLLAADRAKAQQEYDRAAKEYRSASFKDSEDWITENAEKMRDAGAEEIEIARSTYDAWARVVAKKEQYNPEDQIAATQKLADATRTLTHEIEASLKAAREIDRDADMAAIEKQAKANEKAVQDQIDALDKQTQAAKELADIEREREKLAELQDQRNKVADDKRYVKIEKDENGNLVEKRVADQAKLTDLDKQIKDQKDRIGDMERDQETRKQREQLEAKLQEVRDSNEKLKAAHEAYWRQLLSDERINADARASVEKNGLETTLGYVQDYLGRMKAEYIKTQNEIMAAGGLFSTGATGSISPAPVYGPPAPTGAKSNSVADIKAQMAAISAKWQTASPEEQQKLHDQASTLGKSIGGQYDDATGKWTFPKAHTGTDSVPGPPGSEPTYTLEAGERILSVSQNRTFEAFMQMFMARETASDRMNRAVMVAAQQPLTNSARPAGVGNINVTVPIQVTPHMDADTIANVAADAARKEVKREVQNLMNGVPN
ncbi:phage tail tape measure protein [Tumebacillus flagellatus]|uniref:Phage tail tape measure protein domain-containing protein n=1 Tax=Tumebacillus flagellatus TaxID=1157490 RepID=A0A074LNR4_9BACL|nr:phage tail tape measure protein [Tumebacillus flagellatus]KEO81488.1 hypothetical protein EL26_20665 [Tumebacillus flagellatus]